VIFLAGVPRSRHRVSVIPAEQGDPASSFRVPGALFDLA
jgi:hypothetical protein